jgi:ribosome-binding factor A
MTPHGTSPDAHGGFAPVPRGSHRAAQVASVISRAVQMEIQRGMSDPRVRGMVTVLGTDLSPDLEDACVRVSVLPGEHGALTVRALNHAHGHFRKVLLEETRMRRVPRVRFELDESLKRAAAVDLALRQAAEERGADPGTEPPSDPHNESRREE